MKHFINQHAVERLRFMRGVQNDLLDYGRRVKTSAQALAPVGDGRRSAEHYADAFYVKKVSGADPHVRVGNTNWRAWIIEFGAVRRHSTFHARAPMRRALILHGLRFQPVRKDRA